MDREEFFGNARSIASARAEIETLKQGFGAIGYPDSFEYVIYDSMETLESFAEIAGCEIESDEGHHRFTCEGVRFLYIDHRFEGDGLSEEDGDCEDGYR